MYNTNGLWYFILKYGYLVVINYSSDLISTDNVDEYVD